MKIIDCKRIAAKILDEETVKKLKGKVIHAVVKDSSGDNLSYLKSIKRTAEKYEVTVVEHSSVNTLKPLKDNEFVLFVGHKDDEVKELVCSTPAIPLWLCVLDLPEAKDVVCAVDQILMDTLGEKYNGPIKTVVIGRSALATQCGMLLLKENHTVTFCHTKTENLEDYCKEADAIVSFAGCPNLIKGDMVKEGAIIVSVGCGFKDGKLCGDIDLDSMKDKDVWVTPTPGGVGVVTTAMLFSYLAG